MLWKKNKDAASSPTDEPALAPWEGLVQNVFRFYQSSYQEIVRLEKWDWTALFDKARRRPQAQELEPSLEALRCSFEEARRREVKEGRRYLGDLRGLLWGSIDQVCQVVEAGEKQSIPLVKVRQNLQKALDQSDLNSARQVIKEILNSLGQLDKQRQATIEQLQKSYRSQMETLQSELQMAHKELQLDGLTQIYNRATFNIQLRKTSQLSYLSGQKSCLIMFDIDHFKKINDTMGHPAGDAVIQLLAKTIVQSFPRKSDFVARYGGEEFAAVLQGTDLSEARELVAKLLVKIKNLKINHGAHVISFTVSAGLAAFQSGETPEQWLARADKALYEAKQLGRDRFTIAPLRDAS